MCLLEDQLIDSWPSCGGPKALFLDYDGTLREFESRPELAVPTGELQELLAAVDARDDLIPHIVSGRDSGFLEAHFGSLRRFTLVAEHGLEIRRPGCDGTAQWDRASSAVRDHESWKAAVRATMAEFVGETPGSHVEEKTSSLVWHYREASDAASGAAAAVAAVARLEELRRRDSCLEVVRIAHGHKIVEVSCSSVSKGLAVQGFCEESHLRGQPFAAVLAVGDDTTDEFMFGAVPQDALTVKVGPGDTSARFRLSSPKEVRRLLKQIVALGGSS
jgi:trehalose 6-phosphate synthase/phosphatase